MGESKEANDQKEDINRLNRNIQEIQQNLKSASG